MSGTYSPPPSGSLAASLSLLPQTLLGSPPSPGAAEMLRGGGEGGRESGGGKEGCVLSSCLSENSLLLGVALEPMGRVSNHVW